MLATPTLLRPALAAASRPVAHHLNKPVAAVLLLPSVQTARPAAMTAVCPHYAASLVASSSRRLTTSTTPAAGRSAALAPKRRLLSSFRRAASTTSHRPPPQTGPTLNRDAATDAAAAAAVAAKQAAAAAEAAASSHLPPLDWNTFFQLRKTRRRIQLIFSVVGGLTGGLGGGMFLGSGIAEPVLGQIPLDPFLTLGLMTFGFATLGWLAGPSIGNMVFYTWKRQYKVQMTLKETQFFARVKKNRVDPSASSAGNPVPDFYGEKISSVAGYRQWLKDQRAFNKKRTTFV